MSETVTPVLLVSRIVLLMLGTARRAVARFSPYRAAIGGCRALTEAALDILDDEGSLEEFRENVRTFAQEVVAPRAAEIDKNNSFPQDVDLFKAMGEFGLHGTHACQYDDYAAAWPPSGSLGCSAQKPPSAL